VDVRVVGQREQLASQRFDDGVEVREGPAGEAGTTGEQGVAGEQVPTAAQ
jgi:hypothetical protein